MRSTQDCSPLGYKGDWRFSKTILKLFFAVGLGEVNLALNVVPNVYKN